VRHWPRGLTCLHARHVSLRLSAVGRWLAVHRAAARSLRAHLRTGGQRWQLSGKLSRVRCTACAECGTSGAVHIILAQADEFLTCAGSSVA